MSAYQPTKSAVNRFAEFINAEYADSGVRGFAYHPGARASCSAVVSPADDLPCVGRRRNDEACEGQHAA
jgi:NAD(P)-dependent dehydrogenase (short-subunit alcohol dehydrogenase family)